MSDPDTNGPNPETSPGEPASTSRWIAYLVLGVLLVPFIILFGVVVTQVLNNNSSGEVSVVVSPEVSVVVSPEGNEVLADVRTQLEEAGFSPSTITADAPLECSAWDGSLSGVATVESSFEVDRAINTGLGGGSEVEDVVSRALTEAGAKETSPLDVDDPDLPPWRYWQLDGVMFTLANQYLTVGTVSTVVMTPPC
jgi:hypothetical protein